MLRSVGVERSFTAGILEPAAHTKTRRSSNQTTASPATLALLGPLDTPARRASTASPGSVSALQRSIGNRRLQRLLQATPAGAPALGRQVRLGARHNPDTSLVNVLQRVHAAFLPPSYANARTTAVASPDGVRMRAENAAAIAAGLAAPYLPSQVLRAELLAAKVPDPTPVVSNQAHHIVERKDPHAEHSRKYLLAADIDLDSAANGVFLPTIPTSDTGDASLHSGSHLSGYAQAVDDALAKAIGAAGIAPGRLIGMGPAPLTPAEILAVRPLLQAAVVNCLAAIRTLLLTSALGLNRGRNVDVDYEPDPAKQDPDDKSPEGGSRTLRSFFVESGLVNA
jgi:hypothetical protein